MAGEWDTEGFDRPNMDVPDYKDAVNVVVQANPNIAVTIHSSIPVFMPSADEVSALVHVNFGSDEGGNVIFWAHRPSWKLPLTYLRRIEYNPTFLNFGSENSRTLYGEDLCVEYRYYDWAKVVSLFHFDPGLSCTIFEYREYKMQKTNSQDKTTMALRIENTGVLVGSTIVQVYVS